MSTDNDIIGTGWEFPPRFDRFSVGPAMLSGAEDVDNSIFVIIHTQLGERIMRGEFGSDIHQLLFEPLNANLKTYMASSLRQSLENNEPRIEIQSLELTQENPGLGRVDIHVTYTLIETQLERNLVVPFYTPDNLSIS